MNNNYVAIMAGGIGSRFWPMSRASYPKQFLDILNSGKTLLQSTFERFNNFIPLENIYIVTSTEYKEIVSEQLPNLPKTNIVGEPERKNTAACIALISFKIQRQNAKAKLIVAPSDHLIEEQKEFEEGCLSALAFAAISPAIVTLGIKPTHPNTGYGYIQRSNLPVTESIYPVKRFTEKPNKETAINFINDGSYFWNAGIFVWKVNEIIKSFKTYLPVMYELFYSKMTDFNTENEINAINQIYSNCESISVDYGILEKATNVYVVPAKFSWSDLGTWNSAWENFEKDNMNNAIAGENSLLIDSTGCIVHSTDKKLIVVGGLNDLIIVNTPDAILVCKKENEQQIKEYLLKVNETKGELYL